MSYQGEVPFDNLAGLRVNRKRSIDIVPALFVLVKYVSDK